jgi:hypothetical protein
MAVDGYTTTVSSSFSPDISTEYQRTSESWTSLIETTSWPFPDPSSTSSESSTRAYDAYSTSGIDGSHIYESYASAEEGKEMDDRMRYGVSIQVPSILMNKQISNSIAAQQHASAHLTLSCELSNTNAATFAPDNADTPEHSIG